MLKIFCSKKHKKYILHKIARILNYYYLSDKGSLSQFICKIKKPS